MVDTVVPVGDSFWTRFRFLGDTGSGSCLTVGSAIWLVPPSSLWTFGFTVAEEVVGVGGAGSGGAAVRGGARGVKRPGSRDCSGYWVTGSMAGVV